MAAAGQQVQVAYLVLTEPMGGRYSDSSSSAGERRNHNANIAGDGTSSANRLSSSAAGQAAAAAAVSLPNNGGGSALAAATAAGPKQQQQQYSVYDPLSNKTIAWSKYTLVDCTQDRYVLLPLAQMQPDMQMVPELVDVKATGVSISMSEAALAFPGTVDNSSGIADLGLRLPSGMVLNKPGGQQAEAAAANADGGKGYGGFGWRKKTINGNLLCGSDRSKAQEVLIWNGTSNAGNTSNRSTGSRGQGSSSMCGMNLPGVTAELPVILTADEGMSSKTYTLFLFSSESAAEAVREMVLPQEAAAAAAALAAEAAGDVEPSAEAAALSAAYFASRPVGWPMSPAQSSNCSLCWNGTYSTRIDAHDCKVSAQWAGTGTRLPPWYHSDPLV
jgi:hypothetical protein